MDAYLRHRQEIEGLLDPRFYPLEWVDKRVWTGAIRTMSNDTAIIGFEVKDYPGGARELHGMFAAGDLDGILALIDECEAFARSLHCTVATIESRSGWARVLKSRGYAPHQLRIQKEL